jgi:predicted transcriptional regulator
MFENIVGVSFRSSFIDGFIKERMPDKDSEVSRIVDRLYEKGYVSRKENPGDRSKNQLR